MNQKKKLSKKQLVKKKFYYHKFMHSILKSKILRSCKFVIDFLKEQDQYKFGHQLAHKENKTGPKRVKQIKTLTGEILCEASDMAKQFSDNFNSFNAAYQRINKNIATQCKGIERTSIEMAKHYFKLSTELDNLNKLCLQRVEIPQFSNLYQRMSDIMQMTGELTVHQGFMINDKLNSQFKYQRNQGSTTFAEGHALVVGSDARFENARKTLDAEKIKLFRKQNYEAWDIQDPAVIKEVYKVRNNFEQAK